MKITVSKEFIEHKEWALETYNLYGRTPRAHSMAIDCELYELEMISRDLWCAYDDWKVDGVCKETGRYIDVKTLSGKYFNINTGQKLLNILAQRNILDGYQFIEWADRPNRPLELGDEVEVRDIGFLSYDQLADALRVSMKVPHGYYVAVRNML